MELQLDEKKLEELVQQYLWCPEDGSYLNHLACYFLEELKKQYPDLFNQ